MLMKTATYTCKNQKNQEKIARRKCQSHLKHQRLSEKFINEQMDIFYNQMDSIKIGTIR